MWKSTLYWRVLANFAMLLFIITTMTVLTLFILSEIETNFTFAAKDIQASSDLETLHHIMVDVPEDALEYALTGTQSSHDAYESRTRDFERIVRTTLDEVSDTSSLQAVTDARKQFYQWMQEFGDPYMQLGDRAKNGDNVDKDIVALRRAETNSPYLINARGLISATSTGLKYSQKKNLELATGWNKDLSAFIGLVNILIAIFAVTLGIVLTRSITTPVRLLKEGTQKIMAGQFEPITLDRSDELGQLAADFNKMSSMLGNNYTRLNAYSELVTALNSHADIATVKNESLRLLCHDASASVGALYLLNAERNVLQLAAGYALKDSLPTAKEFAIGEGIPGQCAAEQRTLEVDDISITAEFRIDTGLVEVAPQYVIAMPIIFHDRILGVLVLGATHNFTDLQKEIIGNSVPQLGVAITNARNFEATQQLSREIAKKNDELNTKNVELEKAYRVKSDFLASMSHELRTPLNSIIGFTSVLLGPNGDPTTDDQRMAMEKVLKNGKHLLLLINDILDFSKLESGRMTVNVDTDEAANVVANSIMTVESLLKAKNLTLKQAIEPNLPEMKTDTLKVKQILVNLLSNATKFTESGEIVVGVSRQKDSLVFSVKDSGIGIERKNFEKIFEEFQQIDNSNTRKYKGTGLGLPISRRLARMLGGDLFVDSELGKGSTFTLTIPIVFPEKLMPEQPPPSRPASPQPQPGESAAPMPEAVPLQPLVSSLSHSGVHILCIDDDPDVIEILKKYLVPEGYSVTGALSGDEGVKLAEQLQPSLITLDIMMPKKDGWQVLRELKTNPATSTIPVVIHSIIENKPLAVSLGAIDVMTKPTDMKQLLALVKRVVGTRDDQILIVDDNVDFTIAIQRLLEIEGFKVQTAHSGSEALELISRTPPSLIFLDLIMPGMDGFEVIRRLQENEQWKNLPVVVFSGKEPSIEEWEVLNTHVREFLKKSEFTQKALADTIKTILHLA